MSEEKTNPSEEIKVTDRRSFTHSGERRTPDSPKTEVAKPRAQAPAAGDTATRRGQAAGSGEPGGLGFESFVQYLAQVALHQMTGTRDPASGEVTANLEEARQTIEILAMLKEKTQGNLTPQEARSLDDLLYHLQIEYSRRAAAAKR